MSIAVWQYGGFRKTYIETKGLEIDLQKLKDSGFVDCTREELNMPKKKQHLKFLFSNYKPHFSYLAWVSFATALNASIWWLNK